MNGAPGILLLAMLVGPSPAAASEYVPDYARIRAGLAKPTPVVSPAQVPRPVRRQNTPAARITISQRDSVWNGLLIGAGIGATGGYIWARNECGDDSECAAITNPVGILVGGAIGAAAGAILDALNR
jgi:hypothetical protein